MAHKALIFLLFLSLFLNYAGANEPGENHLLIYEVSPYSYTSDEDYICIVNPTGDEVNLSGYVLTDFEGNLTLRGKLKAGERLWIAKNSTAFSRYFGFAPEYEFGDLGDGKFSLANHGDEVALIHDGIVEDMVVYGDSEYTGPGWIGEPVNVSQGHILRRSGFQDTDSKDDWTNYHRIGQSDFGKIEMMANLEVFVYPDNLDELYRFIDSARRSLDIEIYTFSSVEIMKHVAWRIENGTRVRILLEGAPVGGIPEGERYVVEKLSEMGANIKFMVNYGGRHNRYTYIHSKFAIKDRSEVLISTENFDEKALSPCGNRGFGVIVRNEDFASYVERIFEDDVKDVQDIVKYDSFFSFAQKTEIQGICARAGKFEPLNLTARIRPILAPDFSLDAFLSFVDYQDSVDVEALYVKDLALDVIYPKANRILVENPVPGYDMKEFRAEEESLRMLHGKAIIGSEGVLVGSMNFARASMIRNRELSIVIESREAAHYFESILDYDWNPPPQDVVIMRVFVDGNIVTVNLEDSLGPVREIRIILDGKEVSRGEEKVFRLTLPPGEHGITAIVKFEDGKIIQVHREIYIETQNVDLRPAGFLVIFAFFLYKVWKDHGRVV